MSSFDAVLSNLDKIPTVGQRIAGMTQGQQQQSSALPSAQARLRPLYEERAQKSVPTDATGEEYRMGIGGRILGTLANFLSGVNGGGAMVYTGPGATNNRFAQAERRRVGELNALDSKIADTEKLNEAGRNDYVLATQQANRAAEKADREKMVDPESVYYDEQNGKWKGKTYGGQEQEVMPPKWYQQMSAKAAFDLAQRLQAQEQQDARKQNNPGKGQRAKPYR